MKVGIEVASFSVNKALYSPVFFHTERRDPMSDSTAVRRVTQPIVVQKLVLPITGLTQLQDRA